MVRRIELPRCRRGEDPWSRQPLNSGSSMNSAQKHSNYQQHLHAQLHSSYHQTHSSRLPQIQQLCISHDAPVEQRKEEDWDGAPDADLTKDRIKKLERKAALEATLKGWPWRTEGVPDRVLTQAPFCMNQYNFDHVCSMPEIKQSTLLFSLGSDIERKVMNMVFAEGHLPAAGLSATCQQSFRMCAFWVDIWDISRGVYLDCEKTPLKAHARVSETVIVSPFRHRGGVEERTNSKLYQLNELSNCFRNFSNNFVTLHLHRIPLLTTNLLALVVPYLGKLKHLGIYSCELLHLGHVLDLLKIIRTDRGAGMTKNIELDFYPRFHVGPDPDTIQSNKDYTGSYAATWDNHRIDTRVAIWAIIDRAMETAATQGVDLVSKGKALRLWLDKGPCWMVEETITALQMDRVHSPKTCREDCIKHAQKAAAMVRYPDLKGNVANLMKPHMHWNFQDHVCVRCGDLRLGIFFSYVEFAEYEYFCPLTGSELTCLGCILTSIMDQEKDHYKVEKNKITTRWLTVPDDDSPINTIFTEDLSRVCDKEYYRFIQAFKMARNMDNLIAAGREKGLRSFGTIGVDCEIQSPDWKWRLDNSPCIYNNPKDVKPSQW